MPTLKRRTLLALAVAFAAPRVAASQHDAAMLPRVGILISETLSGQASRIDALRTGLLERGQVDGKSIRLVVLSAEGDYQRLPQLAAELLSQNPAVVVAFGIKALTAARSATATVPIVVPSTSSDLLALGLVRSLARPGGNVTGAMNFGPEVAAKRLELLKQVRPDAYRVAVLVNPANTSFGPTMQRMEISAKALRLLLRTFAVRSPDEFDATFAAIAKARSDAMVVQDDTIFGEANAAAIAQLAQRHRLPSLGSKGFAEAGGLVGYGSLEAEMYRRGAHFVDRILRGAKPGDLPIEQATRFELVLNASTARSIGITFPQAVVLRADRLIE